MKTNQEIETEIRNIFKDARWDKRFTKTASKVVEEIRKEKGFDVFTTKERVAIIETICYTLIEMNVKHMNNIMKLKRDVLILMIITGLLSGVVLGIFIKGIVG